ncbi:chemotaxis protein CheD [bacterium]|nr:chemotaxis protein CheD [bacterium]
MNMNEINIFEKIVIHPGEFYATNKEALISTLLGSCVSACLFDPVNKVLGMNHFLLSSEKYKKNGDGFSTPSGRYGVNAMELLINKMYQLGAVRSHLKAKAFGGSTLQRFNNGKTSVGNVGEANLKFVREFLANEKIPLMAEDMGGTRGRTIYFDSRDYSVYVRKHQAVKLVEIFERERQYSERLNNNQTEANTNICLWN